MASVGAGPGGRLILSDCATWRPLRRSEPTKLGLRGFSHSPKYGFLATAGADRVVRLWGDDNAVLVAELLGHHGPVVAVACNDAARHVCSCDTERAVRVWCSAMHACLQTVQDNEPQPPENAFSSLFLDVAGGKLVAAGSYLSMWSVDTKVAAAAGAERAGQPSGHDSRVVATIWSAAFDQCITVAAHGDVLVHEYAPDGKLHRACRFGVCVERGHGEGATIATATLDGTCARLLTGATDGSVRLWNVNSGEMMALPLPMPGADDEEERRTARDGMKLFTKPAAGSDAPAKAVEVTALAWLPGSLPTSVYNIAATGWAGAFSLWGDPAVDRYVRPLRQMLPPPSARVAAASGGAAATDVLCMACCANKFIAVGTADGRLMLWWFTSADLRLGNRPKTIVRMPSAPGAVAAVEKLLWLPSRHALLLLLLLQARAAAADTDTLTRCCCCCCCCRHALLLLGDRGRAHLYYVEGEQHGTFENERVDLGAGITAAALSADTDCRLPSSGHGGTRLAVGDAAGQIFLYSTETAHQVPFLRPCSILSPYFTSIQ